MRAFITLLLLLSGAVANASSIRIPIAPESNTIDRGFGFAIIERLEQPAGLCRVRIVVPKSSQSLPLNSISLIIGKRDSPDISLDLSVQLGTSDSAETTFEISDKFLNVAIVSAHYANYSRSSAAELYEFQLKLWLKNP